MLTKRNKQERSRHSKKSFTSMHCTGMNHQLGPKFVYNVSELIERGLLATMEERALRFIYEDYDSSYEDLLQKSKLPSLKIRRIRTIAMN
jgi:hypothetical protein